MDVIGFIAVANVPAPTAAGRAPQGAPLAGTPAADEPARSFADTLAAIGQPLADPERSDQEITERSPVIDIASIPSPTPHQDAVQPGFVPGWAVLSFEGTRVKERTIGEDDLPAATESERPDDREVVQSVNVQSELIAHFPAVDIPRNSNDAVTVAETAPEDPEPSGRTLQMPQTRPGPTVRVPSAIREMPSESTTPGEVSDEGATVSSVHGVEAHRVPPADRQTASRPTGDERTRPETRVADRFAATHTDDSVLISVPPASTSLRPARMGESPDDLAAVITNVQDNRSPVPQMDRGRRAAIASIGAAAGPASIGQATPAAPPDFSPSRDWSDRPQQERTRVADADLRGAAPAPAPSTSPVTPRAEIIHVDLHAMPHGSIPPHGFGVSSVVSDGVGLRPNVNYYLTQFSITVSVSVQFIAPDTSTASTMQASSSSSTILRS